MRSHRDERAGAMRRVQVRYRASVDAAHLHCRRLLKFAITRPRSSAERALGFSTWFGPCTAGVRTEIGSVRDVGAERPCLNKFRSQMTMPIYSISHVVQRLSIAGIPRLARIDQPKSHPLRQGTHAEPAQQRRRSKRPITTRFSDAERNRARPPRMATRQTQTTGRRFVGGSERHP
jgi:hypothetical protein